MGDWIRIAVQSRPKGEISVSDFKINREKKPEAGQLKQDQILVEMILVSVDPAMRIWLSEEKSYFTPVKIGELMPCGGLGKVIASRNSEVKVGDYVTGFFKWENYFIATRDQLTIVPKDANVPLSAFLGPLGITGLTGYFGMIEVGKIKKGDVVLVSGAAGATGSIAAQIAKIHGCKVVGIAGGKDKCRWLTEELGLDSAIDYKGSTNLANEIKKHCPEGIDVYFDNVGGSLLDIVLNQIRNKARIVICGAISQYNENPEKRYAPKNYLQLIFKNARMEGFIVTEFASQFRGAVDKMAGWVREGKLKYQEQFVDGLENAPKALIKLFHGENTGKLLVRVKQDSTVHSKL